MRASGFVAVVVAAGLPACDAVEPTRAVEQSIIDGTPAPDDVAVVGVGQRAVTCGGGPTTIECTGTLVAPRVVVTAAHCLAGTPPNAQQVFFGASFSAGGITIPVIGGRAHPAFDPLTHANDIAALILESPAPGSIAPIAMRTTALPDLTGTSVRIVGFGLTANTSTETGERRTGTARVTAVSAEELTMEAAPAMSCQGDSGGPVLLATGSGEELVGVTSHGDRACATLGVAVRVDRHVTELIQPILDEAAALPPRRAFDADAPLCTMTCTVDADCPAETVCFAHAGATHRCVYRGLPPGELGEPCTNDACELACVALPDGSCRRHIPCDYRGRDPCGAGDSGCGCRAAQSTDAAVLCGFVLVFVTRRRREERDPDRRRHGAASRSRGCTRPRARGSRSQPAPRRTPECPCVTVAQGRSTDG